MIEPPLETSIGRGGHPGIDYVPFFFPFVNRRSLIVVRVPDRPAGSRLTSHEAWPTVRHRSLSRGPCLRSPDFDNAAQQTVAASPSPGNPVTDASAGDLGDSALGAREQSGELSPIA
jgi:hypothetical protein